MALPKPVLVPIEISPTIEPTTLNVAASLNAGKRKGLAAGSRSLISVDDHEAA